MSKVSRSFKPIILLIICALAFSFVPAQKKSKKKTSKSKSVPQTSSGKPVMWEKVDISQRNLFDGPGGKQQQPDLSNITFIKEEKGGSNKKYRVKDGAGQIWVAKIGREAQSETASVRLIWGLGYKTEINYLVPSLTIPGKGTFSNVRLEARPENIDRQERWKWKQNPFSNTNEFQGLKIMMAFLNNWDLKGESNNIILFDKKERELQYVVSDLGATFGKVGSNRLPIFWRLGRSRNNPVHYSNNKFIEGIKNGRIKFSYKGRMNGLFKDITLEQGRWLADLLLQMSDEQIEDVFRAANYSPQDIKLLAQTVKIRIADLDRVTSQNRLAGR